MTAQIGIFNRNSNSFKIYKEFDDYLNVHQVYCVKDGYFIVYERDGFLTRGKYLEGQFEMPIKALEWFLSVMARFKLPESMGGYKNEQFTDFLYVSKDDDIPTF